MTRTIGRSFKSLIAGGLIGAFSLFAATGLAEAATLRNIHIGNWLAGAYSNDQTGAFSHCAASANYRSGVSMLFAINKNYQWSVGFADPNWHLTRGARYPISLSVDGMAPLSAIAVAVGPTLVEATLTDSTALFDTFKYGGMLRVYAAGRTFSFQLTDTSALLPSLLACVKRYKDDAPTTEAANPFAAPQPNAPPAETPAVRPIEAADTGLAHRAEATSLVANILAQSGVSGFQILPPDDARKLNGDAAWRAGDAYGTVSIVGRDGDKPEDLNAALLSSDSKACHDQFLSGSMPDASGSRMFTTCRSPQQTLTVFYTTIKRPDGGYYVLATGGIEKASQVATPKLSDPKGLSPDQAAPAKPTRDLDSGIRQAAFKIVTH